MYSLSLSLLNTPSISLLSMGMLIVMEVGISNEIFEWIHLKQINSSHWNIKNFIFHDIKLTTGRKIIAKNLRSGNKRMKLLQKIVNPAVSIILQLNLCPIQYIGCSECNGLVEMRPQFDPWKCLIQKKKKLFF